MKVPWTVKYVLPLVMMGLLGGNVTDLKAQREPDPNTGDPQYTRWGIMDGNFVRTLFANHGEIARWPDQPSGEWPKGSGQSYVDGVALVVQAAARDIYGNLIHPMETNYREFVDVSPEGIVWGWAPLPGYFHPKSKEPAMSDDPSTWPEVWPDKPEWSGYWNGFFGKGVMNADLETYFVFDDDPDEEFRFYPDPTDTTRRGLGMEVAARLFQWSHVLAADAIFAIYFVTNEGKTDYDSTFFAFYIDWGIGGTGDSADDSGGYNTLLDIAWAWDYDGFGSPGRWSPVGQGGFAFLESPGIPWDHRDNDQDGVIDERRDSGPGVWLDTYPYGVDDPEAFKIFYDRDPKPHWSGDEDQDWRGFEDLNENGTWDPGEPLYDDVGADGLGPFDPNYTGPDEGEADGMPTPGEPNFDALDKDESDQIGLTGFEVFPVHYYELWNDEQDWQVFRRMVPPGTKRQELIGSNLGMFFSSGPFPMKAGQTENYSMALIFGMDEEDLMRRKKTVQQIYNADYHFAKPPDKPKLTAIPGDRKVILIWDDRAERSWDPFLQEYDFEGYRIYRSTEPEFLENRIVTDAWGRPTFRKPIAQFDLNNGIKGLHPIDVNGVKFDLGSDTGLRHVYIDTDVQNGQTYYYAVVSYDRGFTRIGPTGELEGIAPSECTATIKVDVAGNVETDVNTAVVTPNPPAAGYIPPKLERDIEHEGPGTGTIELNFVIPDSVLDGHTYEVSFTDTALFHNALYCEMTIRDVTADSPRTIVENLPLSTSEAESPIFDGIILNIRNAPRVSIDRDQTGWVVKHTNYFTEVGLDPRFTSEVNPLLNLNISYPADFEIIFADSVVDYSEAKLGFRRLPTKFTVWNLTEDKKAKFLFDDVNKDSVLNAGDQIIIFVDNPRSLLKVATTWRVYFEADTLAPEEIPPQPGDVFRIVTTKPFRTGDRFRFTVSAPHFEVNKAKAELDKITVVPNPYVVTASWEPRSPYRFGRGERRIYFINLPPKCTIRIYTVRGYLVDTIYYESNISYGAVAWDLMSKDGMDIAYGVYIYHVEAPGIGEKIGKFAIIK